MDAKILVLGDLSKDDEHLIWELVRRYHLTIEIVPSDLINTISFSSLPVGFISFLPCTPFEVISLFSILPLGAGEKIPFFQMVDKPEIPSFLIDLPICGVFTVPLTQVSLFSIIQTITRSISFNIQHNNLTQELIQNRKQKLQIIQIGTALSRENNIGKLLDTILSACRQVVGADAGSIYIRERKAAGGPFIDILQFKVSQNDSVVISEASSYSIPINDSSIAGFVARKGYPLNIDDILRTDENLPYRSIGRNFEKRFGYRIKSMLTLPLKNMDGEVVGVLQLINKKKDASVTLTGPDLVEQYATSFTLADEEFVQSVASQAAVSIERAQLHENIQALFEGFLGSSIASIDERDLVTSGHSRRVMGYALAFADAAVNIPESPFSVICATAERRRQFQFAALLHDIGKIGVPEKLLTKNSRLSDDAMMVIFQRIEFIALQKRFDLPDIGWESVDELYKDREFIERVNRIGNLSNDDILYLKKIKNKTYRSNNNEMVPFLSDEEFSALMVQYGNLTTEERQIINSHALSTYRILSKIPWPRTLEQVPQIASQHHEKLDGSGYPNGMMEGEILMESKILAVIDIYEALVSQDRPYKPKMPCEKALDILKFEADKGRLDRSVIDFFIEKDIYKLYSDS
jgi:HD-GYP domain-containing protein (c-di-GMP phosphodiesterase class II)